jgi:hypothetical protein
MKRLFSLQMVRVRSLGRQLGDMIASHVSSRAALSAFCFFLLASAAIKPMEAGFRRAVVKEARYSLVEDARHAWQAPDLRVGWERTDVYVALSDYAILETLTLLAFSSSVCMLLTPAVWLTGWLRRRPAPAAADSDADEACGAAEAQPATAARPLAEA